MTGRRRTATVAAVALILGGAIGVPVGLRLGAAGELIDIETSPDRRERIELYRPNRWQRITGHDSGDYAVARLASTGEGTILAVSPPFYLDGAGTTRWSAQDVAIGVAARYDRTSGRWTVP